MSNIMELIDAYIESEDLQWVNKDAPAQARAAVQEAVEKLEKDAARLEWLEQNLFNRENIDWITGKVSQTHLMWVMFAPVGVQGSARTIIDAAMKEATNEQGN